MISEYFIFQSVFLVVGLAGIYAAIKSDIKEVKTEIAWIKKILLKEHRSENESN